MQMNRQQPKVNATLHEGRERRVVESAGFFHRETGWDTTPAWKRLARAMMKIPSGSSQVEIRASEAFGANSGPKC